MRKLLFAGAAVATLVAGPALAQTVAIGPPAYPGGYYGGHWGYGHSYGYGPGGYGYGWSAPAPLIRTGYAWGPTYRSGGHAAYVISPVEAPYIPPPPVTWWRR